MRYESRPNPRGKGYDVWYVNDLSQTEHLVSGWERLTEQRAEDMCRGSNDFLQKVAKVASSYQSLVAEFHRKFGHPAPESQVIPSSEALRFRAKLVEEEAGEAASKLRALARARKPERRKELAVGVLRELADLLYVTFGGFVIFGRDAGEVFAEVQRANMSKEPNPNGGKPLKPDGWEEPKVQW